MTRLLFDERSTGGNGGNVANADLQVGPFDVGAMIFVTAAGSGAYTGQTSNAGIQVTIAADNRQVGSDSFEAQSAQMTFQASTSMMFFMDARMSQTVKANTSYMGTNLVKQAEVDLHVVAIEVT